jgi:diguanylate cyclase (GGDEF)-like protein
VTAAVPTPQKFSILLVDDDPMVVRVLNSMLGDFAPIRFATSGRAALKLARMAVPDLVLLDIEMPEFSGFEVCKAFKSDPQLKDVPIIFITGHESQQLETVGIGLGAADFISKPPNAALVLARVRTYQRLKILSDTMRSAVTMDFVTGAVTRRQLEKALTQEWLRVRRTAQPMALLLLDIDHFGAYNADLGEELGDACLKSVADAVRSVTHRPTDLLGRWDGGKFGLLLPGTPARGARTLADRCIVAVDGLHMDRPITLSVGGCCVDAAEPPPRAEPGAGEPDASASQDGMPASVMSAAAQALDRARAAGGHQARFVDVLGPDPRQALSA